MKRNVYFLSLVLSLFVVGCGAGGGTTTSGVPGDGGGGGNGGGIVPSGPVGTITVTFPGSPAPQAPVYVTDPTQPPPGTAPITERGFRVTASRYETRTSTIFVDDGDGNSIPVTTTTISRVYVKSQDNTVPGSVTLKVPVYTGPSGYLVEVVSFSDNVLNPSFDNVLDPSSTQMIRYGHMDNVQITEVNGVTSITLYPIAHNVINFSSSDLITALNDYSMLVNYNTGMSNGRVPLRNTFNFQDNTSNTFVFPPNVMDNASLTYTVGRSFTRTAPAGVAGDNVYFQGQFYIRDSLLTDDEERGRLWKKYRLNAPDPAYHSPIFQLLNQPGTIIIVIN